MWELFGHNKDGIPMRVSIENLTTYGKEHWIAYKSDPEMVLAKAHPGRKHRGIPVEYEVSVSLPTTRVIFQIFTRFRVSGMKFGEGDELEEMFYIKQNGEQPTEWEKFTLALVTEATDLKTAIYSLPEKQVLFRTKSQSAITLKEKEFKNQVKLVDLDKSNARIEQYRNEMTSAFEKDQIKGSKFEFGGVVFHRYRGRYSEWYQSGFSKLAKNLPAAVIKKWHGLDESPMPGYVAVYGGLSDYHLLSENRIFLIPQKDIVRNVVWDFSIGSQDHIGGNRRLWLWRQLREIDQMNPIVPKFADSAAISFSFSEPLTDEFIRYLKLSLVDGLDAMGDVESYVRRNKEVHLGWD